jgi:hypothetical protein
MGHEPAPSWRKVRGGNAPAPRCVEIPPNIPAAKFLRRQGPAQFVVHRKSSRKPHAAPSALPATPTPPAAKTQPVASPEARCDAEGTNSAGTLSPSTDARRGAKGVANNYTPSPSTGRMRRLRAREREGRGRYELVLDSVTLEDMLRDAGMLRAVEPTHEDVTAALRRFVEVAVLEHVTRHGTTD